ncbi:MAG: NAD-dependent epimerase/dehydratase family protein [Solirubrobacterales bacterium]|nr:NAD-dependent epimerase/dehydratase family protein [Solirubrobacterales bacterium]
MSKGRILITGGAGFIGSHVAHELLERGYRVRALDTLISQVHPSSASPTYLAPDVELSVGDVRDPHAVRRALIDVDRVIHLAARVGVGQSMYEIGEYVSVNSLGTATLLQALLDRPVEQIVVASSMSVYGEGMYTDADGRPAVAPERNREQLAAQHWEPRGAEGRALTPVPTPETKPPSLASIYALNKFEQERSTLLFGQAYEIPTVALRFFNVYGPNQALSNPYTGVLAIFASRLLNDKPPMIFEDGRQRRDFVSVSDVATACALVLEHTELASEVINVGSGTSVSVSEIARRLARILGKDIEPEVTGECRLGDIRHCFADVGKARTLLGFEPAVCLEDGMRELAEWLEGQVADDLVDRARAELRQRGLTV